MKFTRNELDGFRVKLQKTLDEFAKANGIHSMKMGAIRYAVDGANCRFKIEAVSKPKSETSYGLADRQIRVNDQFFRGRTVYKVVSLDGSGKYPISVVTENGKRYKINASSLLEMEKLNG